MILIKAVSFASKPAEIWQSERMPEQQHTRK
jgi:hypothetical protein